MNDTNKNTCRKCGSTFESNAIGRPAAYCSAGCRRAREYELRRLQAQLVGLEARRLHCRLDRSGLMYVPGGTAAELVVDLTHEIERAEARLREPLEGEP